MTHIEDVLLWAVAQTGKPYVLGAEASALDPDPPKFDCSELVQWSCDRAGVKPTMPDGAYWQYRHCQKNGSLISVADGIATRGALLFRKTVQVPVAFDDVPHVAFSAGGGLTVEARGRAWGVGSWGSPGRFQAAGLIPGCDYSPRAQIPTEDELTPDQADQLYRAFAMASWTAGEDPQSHKPTGGGVPHIEKLVLAICKKLDIDPASVK